MSFTSELRRHSRPLGLALALPVLLAFGATDALAQEREEAQERPEEMQVAGEQDLMDAAEGTEEIALFVQAIQQAGLADALKGEEQFTLLAPTNDAVREHFSDEELKRFGLYADKEKAEREREKKERMDRPERQEDEPFQEDDEARYDQPQQEERIGAQELTQADRQDLVRFVRAHIVVGEWSSERLRTAEHVHNVLGEELAVQDDAERRDVAVEDRERAEREDPWDEAREIEPAGAVEEDLQIGDAEVVHVDIRATNGVIHVIDTVIEPREELTEEDPAFEDEADWQEDERDWQDDDPADDYDPSAH